MVIEEGIGKATLNPYQKDGKILLSKVSSTGNLKKDIFQSVNMIGGFHKVIEKGDEILLKPGYNTGDPPPASSDPDFLKAVVELLFEHGAGRVVVGESSMAMTSTRKVMGRAGALAKLQDAGAEVAFFDEGKWVKVSVGGKYVKTVSLAERAL